MKPRVRGKMGNISARVLRAAALQALGALCVYLDDIAELREILGEGFCEDEISKRREEYEEELAKLDQGLGRYLREAYMGQDENPGWSPSSTFEGQDIVIEDLDGPDVSAFDSMAVWRDDK